MNQGREHYYRHLFVPLCGDAVLYLVATCGGRFRLCQREVGVRVRPREDQQQQKKAVWVRNRIFGEVKELRAEVASGRALCVDFGGIYEFHHLHNQPAYAPKLLPGECNLYVSKPRRFEQKVSGKEGTSTGRGELVIDVDLDCGPGEYSRELICKCGTAKRTCDACWIALMRPAHHALTWALREFWGLKRFFTVFSGRRGFHMWICDERILDMPREERVSFVQALARPSKSVTPDEFTDGMYALLAPFFDNHPQLRCRYQGPFAEHTHREAVFDALWPRLDLAVSCDPLHMRKIPLGLHEETGAVCLVMPEPGSPNEFVPSRDTLIPQQCDEQQLRVRLVDSAAVIARVYEK